MFNNNTKCQKIKYNKEKKRTTTRNGNKLKCKYIKSINKNKKQVFFIE